METSSPQNHRKTKARTPASKTPSSQFTYVERERERERERDRERERERCKRWEAQEGTEISERNKSIEQIAADMRSACMPSGNQVATKHTPKKRSDAQWKAASAEQKNSKKIAQTHVAAYHSRCFKRTADTSSMYTMENRKRKQS